MSDVTLVTGGAGFVGKHLVEKLRNSGARVRSFDLAAPSHADDVQGSIMDTGAVSRAMKDVTDVFHLAGYAQLWAPDPMRIDAINRIGAEVVVSTAKSTGIRRFIHCSSLTTLVGAKNAHRSVRGERNFAPGTR